MDFFKTQLHHWYSINRRDLPWRYTRNPYYIWLSEVILQQTRIDQGLTYFNRFVQEYPEIKDLAEASEDQVLKLWQGLGYYSRARNLHFTAKYITKSLNGNFPDQYDAIRKLKGVGDYTASAIASIAFNLEHAALDGNVFRVLSRFFGIYEPTDTNAGKEVFGKLARELIKGTDPGMHNQSIMEFGALQCVPKNPDCNACPLQDRCYAKSMLKINELPVKKNKVKQLDRYFTFLVIKTENSTFLRKRINNDIWRNLFEFPVIESTHKTELPELIESKVFNEIVSINSTIEHIGNWELHLLTHRRIHYRIIRINVPFVNTNPIDCIKVNKQDISNFAVPKLLESYIIKNMDQIFESDN